MTYINKKRKLRSSSYLEEEEAIMKDEEAMLEEAGEADGCTGENSASETRRHSPRRTRGKSDASARSAAAASAETPAISNASKRRKGKKAASSGATAAAAAAKYIAPSLKEGDEDGGMDADDTPPTKISSSRRPRTRSRGLSMASAATTGGESAGPTIAGPIIEVVDPASLLGGGMDGFDGAGGKDRLLSFADGSLAGGRDRLFSFGVGTDGGLIDAAGSPDDHFPSAPVAGSASGGTSGRSRKLSVDFSLTGSHPPHSDHSGHHPHGDPVDSLVGTAVDALLGSRPRSMSQESIGSLGLRSRSNTIDLMAGAGLLEGSGSDLLGLGGSGGRSRSNTLEFLSGVALGEGIGAPDGPDGHVHFDTNMSGKIRSGSHGSYSSHQSGASNLSSSRKVASSLHVQQRTGRGSQRNKRRNDTISSALDHLDALGETKPAAVSNAAAAAAAAASGGPGSGASRKHAGSGATASSANDGKNRKNSDHSQDSANTLDSAHQKLLYEALISGGGASGIGSGGRQRSDTTESWTALVATSARERADSWGGMSDISFGAAAGHADIVAEITANALHHDVTASSVHVDASDTAGGLALVQMATPPTSAQASLASGSTGPGAAAALIQRGKKSSAPTSKTSSVPKKIAVNTKKSTAARPANATSGSKIKSTSKMRRADSSSSGPVVHSLSVNFPKNMPHGAAAAAAKAAAEAATAAGASPAELSAIVAAAMATVSKQLFNIASDVEKAIASTKTGGKTPPGMKKVKIEYTARPIAKAKSGKPGATPAVKPGVKPVVRPEAAVRSLPATGSAVVASKPAKKVIGAPVISSASTTVGMPPVTSEKQQKAVARHPGPPASSAAVASASGLSASTSIPLPGPKVASQVVSSSTAVTKAAKLPTEKKRLPPRKRTDSGFGLFDIAMSDLPAPLPNVPPQKKTPAPASVPQPAAAAATGTAALTVPSATNSQISVDYDAVAAAVDAASTATLSADATKVAAGATAAPPPATLNHKIGPSGVPSTIIPSGHLKSPPSSTVANTAPQPAPKTPAPQPPLKKRTKRPTPPDNTPVMHNRTPMVMGRPPMPSSATSTASSAIASAVGNGTIRQNLTTPGAAPRRLVPTTPATGASTSTAGSYSSIGTPGSAMSYSTSNTQSNQKWDEMFDCLVEYVKQQNAKHAGTVRGGKQWKWDGNVPTTYKTKDGKALGRWINNQRSAKTKGSLKPEREERLLSTGLKWSVLSTNAWPDMLRELRRYVQEKEASGETWDGNVPTNFRIKAKGSDFDEDKNLGRWINRQRSLYQAGKLKKERQEELERIGLRWSVLSTTSWDVMYDALLEYADDRRAENPESGWDGNVPANFKTDDNPPKSLGRWVNRQRSAYAKNKLKQEFVARLEQAGLKWSVHERRDFS